MNFTPQEWDLVFYVLRAASLELEGMAAALAEQSRFTLANDLERKACLMRALAERIQNATEVKEATA